MLTADEFQRLMLLEMRVAELTRAAIDGDGPNTEMLVGMREMDPRPIPIGPQNRTRPSAESTPGRSDIGADDATMAGGAARSRVARPTARAPAVKRKAPAAGKEQGDLEGDRQGEGQNWREEEVGRLLQYAAHAILGAH